MGLIAKQGLHSQGREQGHARGSSPVCNAMHERMNMLHAAAPLKFWGSVLLRAARALVHITCAWHYRVGSGIKPARLPLPGGQEEPPGAAELEGVGVATFAAGDDTPLQGSVAGQIA